MLGFFKSYLRSYYTSRIVFGIFFAFSLLFFSFYLKRHEVVEVNKGFGIIRSYYGKGSIENSLKFNIEMPNGDMKKVELYKFKPKTGTKLPIFIKTLKNGELRYAVDKESIVR